MKKRMLEIEARKAELSAELDAMDFSAATEEQTKRMAEIEEEVRALEAEEASLRSAQEMRTRLGKKVDAEQTGEENSDVEARAKRFAETNRTSVSTRSLLSTNIAKSTDVSPEIKDLYGVQASSIVDLVDVEDCTGMGTLRVAYEKDGFDANDDTVEGSAPKRAADPASAFGYVDIQPSDVDVLAYISKKVRKQSPLQYEAKTLKAARTALIKKLSKKIVDAVYASELASKVSFAKDTTNGAKIGPDTLRKIALGYGGDEGVGGGVLVLSKEDLIAFGDVRGTNEKKAIYEITPDTADENTGTIKEGGLVVRYFINKNCNVFQGNKSATANTMLYGNLKNIKMGVWGDIEVSTSEDYKFAEGMLTVLGEAEVGVDLVVKNGFEVVTIA